MQELDMIINRLPAPTWNRLKLNQCDLKGIPAATGSCMPKLELQGGVCVSQGVGHMALPKSCCCAKDVNNPKCTSCGVTFENIATGIGEDIEKLGSVKALRLVVEADVKSVAAVTLEYQDGQQAYNKIEIEAKAGSDITVIMTYISTSTAEGTASVQTKIAAAPGAKVRLVQVQLLGKGFNHFNDIGCEVADNARFESLQLQLGATGIYDGCRTELLGSGSSFDSAIGYYGRDGQQLDINFVANHHGQKTVSNMTADGVLMTGAKKIFRGTIDFKNGSAGAQGDENETVLLLTDDIVNKSVPLILCAEEDVVGNHGASIGKLDDDLLFYLCSRGFSEQEAVNMMAKAKIDALCRKIGNEDTVQLVERYLEGVVDRGE